MAVSRCVFLGLICLTYFVSFSLQYKTNCTQSSDCPSNSHCNFNVSGCFCNEGFVDDQRDELTCLQVATNITDACIDDIQCRNGLGSLSYCKKDNPASGQPGYCACQNNSHFVQGSCIKISLIGDDCTKDINCYIRTREVSALCDPIRQKCVCPLHYHSSIDKGDCIMDASLGGTCQTDSDCFADHSYCSSVCKCKRGFAPNANGTLCLTAATELGQTCTEDGQCNYLLENSFCQNGTTCACNINSHYVNKSSCLISVFLGGSCHWNEECLTKTTNYTSLGCINGLCACRKGYKSWKGDCISGASYLFGEQWLHLLVLTILAILFSRN